MAPYESSDAKTKFTPYGGSYGRSSTLSGAAWGTTEAQLIIFQSGSRRNKFGTTARGPRDVVEGALDYVGTVTTCVCIYTPAIAGVSQCPLPVSFPFPVSLIVCI